MDEKRHYNLTITINGPGGAQQLQVRVPEDQMQCCPCGHDLFQQQFRVVHVKPALFHPAFLGVPEVCCAQPIYVCAKCGYELSSLTPTKEAVLASNVA